MTAKRRLVSLGAFVLAFLAIRAAFHRTPTRIEAVSVELSAPPTALKGSAAALFSNPRGAAGVPSGRPSQTAAPSARSVGAGPESAHAPQRWTAGSAVPGSYPGSERAAGPAAGSSFSPAREGQNPTWQMPPARGGRSPTAGLPSYPSSSGGPGRVPPSPPGSAGGAPAAAFGNAAPVDAKPASSDAALASARADAGSGSGLESGLALPNARPSGSAGPGSAAANPDDLGPVRTMGARDGEPDKGSAPRAAAGSRPAGGDGGDASPADAGGSASGDSGSGAAPPDGPKGGAGPGGPGDGSGDGAAGAPSPASKKKAHGHRGRGAGAASGDPSSPDGGAPAADPEDATGDAPGNTTTAAPGYPGRELVRVTPVVGAPVIESGAPNGDAFAETAGGAATVQTTVIQTATAKAVEFTAKMAIDPNGAGGWYHAAPTAQRVTALQYPDGKNLNPGKIPYVVIPSNFSAAKLGDYATVTYGGKTVYAIVGDYGPAGVIGAGSMVLASGLGINADPVNGGVRDGVSYTILSGSGGAAIPADAAGVEAAGKAAFDKAGIPVR